MSTVWIDGALVDESEARVSPFDHGLLTGDGVFETMKVVRGRAFAARRHLDRLARSTAGMRLPCPPREVVLAAMDEVIAANGWDELTQQGYLKTDPVNPARVSTVLDPAMNELGRVALVVADQMNAIEKHTARKMDQHGVQQPARRRRRTRDLAM